MGLPTIQYDRAPGKTKSGTEWVCSSFGSCVELDSSVFTVHYVFYAPSTERP